MHYRAKFEITCDLNNLQNLSKKHFEQFIKMINQLIPKLSQKSRHKKTRHSMHLKITQDDMI